jgi:Mor family transcriptional regulator
VHAREVVKTMMEMLRPNGENAVTATLKVHLTEEEREQLRLLARSTKNVRVLRRAQVLLGLDRGERVIELAERYQVSRATVYNWIRRYRRWGISVEAMMDRPRPGRPGRRGGSPGAGG